MPKVETNRVVINYETLGKGEPLLFIHGTRGSWKMWQPQFEAFSAQFRMIMMDLRGHGASRQPLMQ